MLRLQKVFTLVAACLMVSSIFTPASYGRVGASPSTPLTDNMATITAAHGDVFKRDFVDWNREAWGDPEPAKVADQLREGMQIGTGNASWAEVAWPNVKTRAWENTVFAVAPNKRLVYLTGGEMLFRLDKHRKDKEQAYYIWTKVLQARIRGTTVMVQCKGNVSRITVLEGKIDVYNRLDHSSVTISPGTVYEITGHNMSHSGPLPAVNGAPSKSTQPESPASAVPYRPQPLNTPRGLEGLQDITFNSRNAIPLFQDSNARSMIYTANAQSLMDHGLVTKFPEALDSLPLIVSELKTVPGYSNSGAVPLVPAEKLNQVVFASTQIKGVPTNADYYIGAAVGKEISMPQSAYMDFPPAGVILNSQPKRAQASVTALNHVAPPMLPALRGFQFTGHELPPGADAADPAAQQAAASKIFGTHGAETSPDAAVWHTEKGTTVEIRQVKESQDRTPAVIPPYCQSQPEASSALGAAFQPAPAGSPSTSAAAVRELSRQSAQQ